MKIFTIICTLVLLTYVESGKILGIFYFPSKSHHILGAELLKALAKKGHQVTMVSPYTIGEHVDNYKEVIMDEMLTYKEEYMQEMLKPSEWPFIFRIREMIQQIENITNVFWQSKATQDLIATKEKYDLVIAISIGNDALLALAHKLGAPTIVMSTVGSSVMTNKYTGNPTPYSYVHFIGGGGNFLTRLQSTTFGVMSDVFSEYSVRTQDELRLKLFPNTPPIRELVHNVSLVFLNSHYSIESIRPYLPNMVQIGGFHISEPKALPNDIKTYLDKAEDGAIFFSLGSNVKLSKLPEGKKNVIIKTLGKLKQKVLLKTDESIENLPKNIKTGKWFPQNDILAHPNVKAFITHGGLLSTMEAVYHGVPLVGLPCFGDQEQNMEDTSKAGYAIKLDILSITEDSFYEAITEILNNPRYKENIQKRSTLFKEQPIKPLDNAIFWAEHVIKHRGAAHLRSPRLNLYLYQYLLLDVVAFIAAIIVFVILILYFTLKTCFKLCRRVRQKSKRE